MAVRAYAPRCGNAACSDLRRGCSASSPSPGPLSVVVIRPGPAAADIKSDQTQVAQLGRQIATDGQAVQTLVVEYDQALTHEAAIEAQVTSAQDAL